MRKRIRHHINPFSVTTPKTEEDWTPSDIDNYPKIHVDMGCYKGEFIETLATENKNDFFIGVEIRDKVLEEYLDKKKKSDNLKYLCANISISIPHMFKIRKMDYVYINFPDPYSKKERLKKRRLINSSFIETLYQYINEGGMVYIQSDNKNLADDIIADFAKSKFSRLSGEPYDTLKFPFTAKTDWQTKVEFVGKPIYRMIYTKR